MNKKIILPVIVILFLCLGLFLLGKGITGMVSSQSCCFDDNCSKENLCDAAKSPSDAGFAGFGIVLVLVSGLVFVMLHSKISSV